MLTLSNLIVWDARQLLVAGENPPLLCTVYSRVAMLGYRLGFEFFVILI